MGVTDDTGCNRPQQIVGEIRIVRRDDDHVGMRLLRYFQDLGRGMPIADQDLRSEGSL